MLTSCYSGLIGGMKDFFISESKPTDRLYGANLSIKKQVFEKVGLFNVQLGRKGPSLAGGEEIDFFASSCREKEPHLLRTQSDRAAFYNERPLNLATYHKTKFLERLCFGQWSCKKVTPFGTA